MPERRIGDSPAAPCAHPEHRPAAHKVREPGTYEHECPACGETRRFTVTPRARLG